MESGEGNFRTVDVVIFAGAFLLSATVGAVFAFTDRKNQSTENYYFGGRTISPIPVAISIAVSYISAISVVAIPAEIYLYGSVYAWYILAVLIAKVVAIVYYIPLYHRLRLNSVYEYLELRFHRRIRAFTSILGVFQTIVYLAITIYLPSLALSAVTPVELTWTIALTSLTCTFYSSLGGMKAVIWADVFQSLIMIGGMVAVFVQTVTKVGGIESVFSAAERGGRNNFLKFDLDPRLRSTAWTVTVGNIWFVSYELVCNQIFVQRWLCCKTIKSARSTVLLSMVLLTIIYILTFGNGLAMYAYYERCDPTLSGKISKPDQLMPRLAVDVFSNTPGMAGLFVSAGFCGTLSTVSSGINSLAAVGLMDYVISIFPNVTAWRKVMLSKVLTVGFGLIVMTIAYLISFSTSNVVQLTFALMGFLGGPILSIFTMGLFAPWINGKGVVTGCICGFSFTCWIGLSAMFSSVKHEREGKLPLSTDNCTSVTVGEERFNGSQMLTQTFAQTDIYTSPATSVLPIKPIEGRSDALQFPLYAVSFFYYAAMGFAISVIVTHITCLFTGFNKTSEANPDLFVPIIDGQYFPTRIRKFFRFGVPESLTSDPVKLGQSYAVGTNTMAMESIEEQPCNLSYRGDTQSE